MLQNVAPTATRVAILLNLRNSSNAAIAINLQVAMQSARVTGQPAAVAVYARSALNGKHSVRCRWTGWLVARSWWSPHEPRALLACLRLFCALLSDYLCSTKTT
jgi:hypothetical protein